MTIAAATAYQFEQLVQQLLVANGFRVDHEATLGRDRGYDLLATLSTERWAVEIKYYRTERAQVTLIEAAAAALLASMRETDARKGMLILSSYLPDTIRASLEQAFGLVFVDRSDIFIWSSKFPALSDQLAALLETSRPDETAGGRPLKELAKRDMTPAAVAVTPDTTGSQLCEELRRLKRGKKHWAAYEKLCDRILRYLFPNDLYGWHKQKRTDDGLNRFDYICRIRPTTDFWHFLIDHLNSRYALFDFKNYSGKIKQGQVLTTEKYLLERALRRTGILFTRVGADPGAIKMAQGAMREHGKLLLVLDDDVVCNMLHRRERGEDPSDLLFDVADEFLIALPR